MIDHLGQGFGQLAKSADTMPRGRLPTALGKLCSRLPPRRLLLAILAIGLCAAAVPARADSIQSQSQRGTHAIAMHGAPKYPEGFTHFPFVNPDAPKGGRVVLGQAGSFDTLNPLIILGEPAAGVREWVYETLMARSIDEPFTMYGLIAERADMPADRRSITFFLDTRARFSDGRPVKAEDVVFSMELLREKGRPNHRNAYKKVVAAEVIDEQTVRFQFDDSGDREMPLIMASMPVLPKHAIDPDAFERTTLVPPIGSGPYIVSRVDAGRSLTYARNPDYWGRDLPALRGRFNFDEIRYEYFRDSSVLFDAFRAGQIDSRTEDDPKLWANGYTFRAVQDGRVQRRAIEIGLPAGMSAFVMNTRRGAFKDQRVRRALILLFNFEWVNKTLYQGLYRRTQSFFARSTLAAAGRPADARERALLAPFPDAVREDVLEGRWRLPESDGSGHNRDAAKAALALFNEAGYVIRDGRLVLAATGEPFSFEILGSVTQQERLLASYVSDLARLGISARIRFVDSAQYQRRLRQYDFDMIQAAWPSSLSPGNEQNFRWSTRAARAEGSFNYAGVESPAVDALIQKLLEADGEEGFISAVRALDRVLISGDYVVPLFHASHQWIAHWSKLKGPETPPLWGYSLDTWWIDGQK
ncbi:MAG: extracellular solute-binding protein [Hyphomicrobium sp.]|nr:extracellular solute-binding protein [Hyphomicrobium sp.]